MKYIASSVIGGLVVAVAFLVLGVTGHRTTQTIVEEGPVAAQPASSSSSGLTPHDIYERDAPGVVFVRAQIIQQVQDPFNLFPEQQSSISTGSGFLVDPRGYILTNYHVIEGADRNTGVTVQFEDNVSRQAALVGQDPSNDLAVLKVNMAGVPAVQPLQLGDSTTVRVGDPTLAIGNPFGLAHASLGGARPLRRDPLTAALLKRPTMWGCPPASSSAASQTWTTHSWLCLPGPGRSG